MRILYPVKITISFLDKQTLSIDSPIISITDSGLGNRIKSMMSVMKMSNDYYIYWPKNKCFSCSFSDLFNMNKNINKLPLIKIYYHNFKILNNFEIYKSSYLYLSKEDKKKVFFKKKFFNPKKQSFIYLNGDCSIDFLYEKIPYELKISYLDVIKKIHFNEKVINFVNNFYEKNKSSFENGIQIRSWIDDPRYNSLYDKNKVFSYIYDLVNTTSNKIFITTDMKNILDEVNLLYPDRFCFFPRETYSIHQSKSVLDDKRHSFYDLIDILLLSKCRNIHGSYLSTFCEVAWWLGQCKSKVNIINPY